VGTPYRDLYVKAGETCPGVSGKLLAAQGKHESGFNPRALSESGAMGIAQFMPGTWPSWGKGDPYNPADAIPAQARFMCALYKRWNGNMDLMLASYNAGEGRVAQFGGVPPCSFARCQTHNYVKSIRAIYKGWD
jgi:soluble lytic murein transglycosylase-like protein